MNTIDNHEDYRYEIKYSLDRVAVNKFEHWLLSAPFLRRAYPERFVNSVYFDTRRLTCAEDNMIGLARRQKLRMRWYGNEDIESGTAVLEAKIKNGRLGKKLSVPMSLPPKKIMEMESGKLLDAFHNRPEVFDLVPKSMPFIPAMYVGYQRQYYVGPKQIRVTVDNKLRFSDVLRDRHMSAQGVSHFEKTIVEFKFPPSAKDDAAQMMQSFPFSPVRCSKYMIGLSLFGHAVYI